MMFCLRWRMLGLEGLSHFLTICDKRYVEEAGSREHTRFIVIVDPGEKRFGIACVVHDHWFFVQERAIKLVPIIMCCAKEIITQQGPPIACLPSKHSASYPPNRLH